MNQRLVFNAESLSYLNDEAKVGLLKMEELDTGLITSQTLFIYLFIKVMFCKDLVPKCYTIKI